eukprot:s1993_g14.t1
MISDVWVQISRLSGFERRATKSYKQKRLAKLVPFLQGWQMVLNALRTRAGQHVADPSVLLQEIESTSSSTSSSLKLEAMLPETGDLESISQLLMESFIEVLEPWMLPASLGPVASAWNWLIMEWERQIIKTTLTVNYKRIMTQPSLRKPKGWQFEGESLGMLLVTDAGNGPEAVAFLELCSLPPDGRTPDDTLGMLLMVFGDTRSARPYLQNFCVAPKWRRRGLGRVLLRMAERVVRDVWREDRIYLHAGSNEAARNLYRSSGYQMTGLLQSPESLHMSKVLEGLSHNPQSQTRSEGNFNAFAAAHLAPHSVMTSASGATRSGLTFSCVRDGAGWNLEVGALSMADDGVCCIDEFRHLPKEEKTALYEAF